MFTFAYFFLTGCAQRPPVVCNRENTIYSRLYCALDRYRDMMGWGKVRARIVSLFIYIGADLHTGAQREAEGPFVKWVTG